VVGDQVHALTLGRSLGFLDQALDLLACVGPGPAFSRARLGGLLAPYLERLSAVIFVGLTWDAERALFVHEVRDHGVACRSFVLQGPGASASAERGDSVVIPVEAIESKEPLCL
jgi:hypothetical protein